MNLLYVVSASSYLIYRNTYMKYGLVGTCLAAALLTAGVVMFSHRQGSLTQTGQLLQNQLIANKPDVYSSTDNYCPNGTEGSFTPDITEALVAAETKSFYLNICHGKENDFYVGLAKNRSGHIVIPLLRAKPGFFSAVNKNYTYVLDLNAGYLYVYEGYPQKLILQEKILKVKNFNSQTSEIPRCQTSQLSVNRISDNASAGHQDVEFAFTNISGETCSLYGYPGMALLDANNNSLNVNIQQGGNNKAQQFTLSNREKAYFDLRYANKGNFYGVKQCPPDVSKAKITPPNADDSLTITDKEYPCTDAVISPLSKTPLF